MATPIEGQEAAATGMPQLDFSTYPNQIFWLVIAMLALYYIVSKIAIPRIGGIIEDRHEVISNDLETAAELREKAAAAEEAYNQALAEARSESQRIAAETKAEIQKEIEAATAKADAEIAAKSAESEGHIREIRDSATQAVDEVARETALAIVAKLMPDAADEQAVGSAVESVMKG